MFIDDISPLKTNTNNYWQFEKAFLQLIILIYTHYINILPLLQQKHL